MRLPSLAVLFASLGALAVSACSPITTFNTVVPKDPSVRLAEGVAYGEGPRRRLDVYAPRKLDRAKPIPVLVFFYGGSWDSGRRQDYSFVGRALASRGFVTIIPDYRLYPEVRFPAFLEDGAQAIRWAQDHAVDYGGDPNRIVLVGHSAGGYNAVMLALDQRYVRAAGVRPGAIKAAAGLAGPYNFYPFDVRSTQDTFGQFPDPQATQPVRFVTKDSTPLFLGYGLKDTVVYPQNIDTLERLMKEKGATVEARRYPDLDHVAIALSLSRPFRGKAPVLADMTTFLKAQAGD